jgi:hypothetical protein
VLFRSEPYQDPIEQLRELGASEYRTCIVHTQLNNEDGTPAAHQRICITGVKDGRVYRGRTDDQGVVYLDDMPEQDYELEFDSLDGETWE